MTYTLVLTGVTLPSPLYGLYQAEYGLSTFTVTALFATYPVGVLVVLLLTPTWSDAMGRRACILIAIGASAASSLVFLAAHETALLFLGRLLTGVASGFVVSSANAALIELAPPDRRPFASVASSTINQLGLGLGALCAGLAADQSPAPERLIFAVHAVLTTVSALALFLVPETAPRATRLSLRPTRLGLPAEGRAQMLTACAAGFVAFAYCGLVAALAPVLVVAVTTSTDHLLAGLAVFSLFSISAGSQPFWSALATRQLMSSALVTMLISIVGLATAVVGDSSAALFAVLCLAGSGIGGVFMGSLRTVNALAVQGERGRVTATYFVSTFVGLVIPVIGTGLLIESYGARTATTVFCLSAFAVVAACLVAVALETTRSTVD